ncbi:hypothetical protein A3Q37_07118 [Streptomyces sp. PTY087I2]|nr:hypothetical protein A3Q37_07118 [Streptomyces sp. PTY087I2]
MQALAALLQRLVVDRVVLEHDQGVEEFTVPGQPLYVVQADVVVREQSGLLLLDAADEAAQRLGRVEHDPYRESVDEQPHHGLDAGDVRRTPRDRRAEHHVVAARQMAEQHGPGSLYGGVRGDAEPTALGKQKRRLVRGEFDHQALRKREVLVAGGAGQQRRLLQAAELVRPGGLGLRTVLLGEPCEVVAVRGHTGQVRSVALRGVQREQLVQQYRRRPAVQQDVVVGDQEPMTAGAQGHERETHQRGSRQVEAPDPVLADQAGQLRIALLLRQSAQVHLGPRQIDLPGDHLDRIAVLPGVESGAQIGVSAQQFGRGRTQGGAVQLALEAEGHLDVVDVRAVLVVEGVEEQSLLQRCERQHVGRLAELRESVDFCLCQRHEVEVGRSVAAGAGIRGVRDDGFKRAEPGVRQCADLVLGEQLPGPAPVGDQGTAFHAVHGQGVQFEGVSQQTVGVAAVAGVRAGHQLPVRRRRGPVAELETAEVVEGDLRCGQRAEGLSGLWVEVTQQPVSGAVVRQRTQLLLDRLEGIAHDGAAVPHLGPLRLRDTGVEADRIEAGEPADRTRDIRAGDELFASVSFEVDQDPVALQVPAASPVGDRQREAGEKDVVDARVEGGGHGGEQGFGELRRQRDGQAPGGGRGVPAGVEAATAELGVLGPEQGGPGVQFRGARLGGGGLDEALSPGTERCPHRGKVRRVTGGGRPVGGRQIRKHDAPGDTVHHQVVCHQEQASGYARTPVEPHGPEYRALVGVEGALGRTRLRGDELPKVVAVDA